MVARAHTSIKNVVVENIAGESVSKVKERGSDLQAFKRAVEEVQQVRTAGESKGESSVPSVTERNEAVHVNVLKPMGCVNALIKL